MRFFIYKRTAKHRGYLSIVTQDFDIEPLSYKTITHVSSKKLFPDLSIKGYIKFFDGSQENELRHFIKFNRTVPPMEDWKLISQTEIEFKTSFSGFSGENYTFYYPLFINDDEMIKMKVIFNKSTQQYTLYLNKQELTIEVDQIEMWEEIINLIEDMLDAVEREQERIKQQKCSEKRAIYDFAM